MPSSSWLVVAAVVGATHVASAQPAAAPGFAVERLDLAPAGAGWIAMDDLAMPPGLGGALGVSLGYEADPLRIEPAMMTNGAAGGKLAVVSDRTVTELSGAVTLDRVRVSLAMETVLASGGDMGVVGGLVFTPPAIDPQSHPDPIADPKLGVDVRLYGSADDRLRLGVSGELFAPNGSRADYDSDGSFRGIVRALIAGDVAAYRYAGYLGVHVRPLDDASVPGSPRGSELVFGAAAGYTTRVACWQATLGPEVMGATAFDGFLGGTSTALEAMLSGRMDQLVTSGRRIRLKLGIGVGLVADFGAPTFRVVAGVEMFGQAQKKPPPR
jgi:hypothetical protein